MNEKAKMQLIGCLLSDYYETELDNSQIAAAVADITIRMISTVIEFEVENR